MNSSAWSTSDSNEPQTAAGLFLLTDLLQHQADRLDRPVGAHHRKVGLAVELGDTIGGGVGDEQVIDLLTGGHDVRDGGHDQGAVCGRDLEDRSALEQGFGRHLGGPGSTGGAADHRAVGSQDHHDDGDLLEQTLE